MARFEFLPTIVKGNRGSPTACWRYGDPSFKFEPGYPLIDNIILYEQKIEILTGKRSEGLYH